MVIPGQKTNSCNSMVWTYNISYIYEQVKDNTRLIILNEV